MKWNQSYSVGVEEIDRQHMKLIAMLAKLIKATDEKNSKSVVKDILGNLVDYTVYHFNTEETYFDKFGYENAEAHKTEHAKFIDKVGVFVKNYEEGKVLLTADIMMFLADWIQNHIKGSDKLYSKCFLENGLPKAIEQQVSISKVSKEIEVSSLLIVFTIIAMVTTAIVSFVVL